MTDEGPDPAEQKGGGQAATSPAARALAEAEARRKDRAARETQRPKEQGRDGPDPVRYGDWEKRGIASDF
jgi:hypothetical protein